MPESFREQAVRQRWATFTCRSCRQRFVMEGWSDDVAWPCCVDCAQDDLARRRARPADEPPPPRPAFIRRPVHLGHAVRELASVHLRVAAARTRARRGKAKPARSRIG